MRPSPSVTPMRSASPSNAMPRSAELSATLAIIAARFSGIVGPGWWCGNRPSGSQKSGRTFEPQTAVGFNGDRSAHAVATVHHHPAPKIARRKIVLQVGQVWADDLGGLETSAAAAETARFLDAADLLDFLAMEGGRPEADLDPVKFRGIVAARDLNPPHPPQS